MAMETRTLLLPMMVTIASLSYWVTATVPSEKGLSRPVVQFRAVRWLSLISTGMASWILQLLSNRQIPYLLCSETVTEHLAPRRPIP